MNYKRFVEFITKKHPEMYSMDAKKIADLVFDAMKDVLLSGNSITIPGMCTLYPNYLDYGKDGRQWRNPHNGEVSIIYSKVQLRCRPTRSFQASMTKRLLDDQ
jgi:nucleoid DNA-binding protein